MNLKQLSYFVAIAEEQQITAAARRLHISQPPLSYELAQLERELGVKLVVRGPRNASLTGAGELLYQRAKRILALTSAARHEVESFGQGERGMLSIGSISSSGNTVPNKAMLALAAHYPDVSFEVHEGNTFEVLDMLESGEVEVGIVRTPFSKRGLSCVYGEEEPLVALVQQDSDLGSRLGKKPAVAIADLANVPVVMYRRFETLVREEFEGRDVPLFVGCMADDARTAFNWARNGFGVGLVPASICETMNAEGLAIVPIDAPSLVTRQAIVWNSQRYLSPLAERFVELFSAAG